MKNAPLKIFILALIILISRIIFIEPTGVYQSVDPIHYILGSENFDLSNNFPHLPGSILYCKLIKTFNIFFDQYHTSLLVINILWLVASIPFAYKIFEKYKIKYINLSLIFVYSIPSVWFFTSITEIYAFDLFFSVFLIYLLSEKKYFFLAPIIFTAGTGYRQSSGVLLAPYFIYSLRLYVKNYKIDRKLIISLVLSFFIIMIWLFPLIKNAGGLFDYLELYQNNNPLPNLSFSKNLVQMVSYGSYFFISLLFFVGKINKSKNFIDLLVSYLPALLFFILFHYNKGYFMLIVFPISLHLILIFKPSRKRIFLATILNFIIYLFLPANNSSYYNKIDSEHRPVGRLEMQIERLFGGYSASRDRIFARQSVFLDVKNINWKEPLICDPSLPIHCKLFAYTMKLDTCYYLSTNNNLEIYILDNFKNKISNLNQFDSMFYFIGHKEFFNNYLINKAELVDSTAYFAIYSVNNKKEYFKLLKKLF